VESPKVGSRKRNRVDGSSGDGGKDTVKSKGKFPEAKTNAVPVDISSGAKESAGDEFKNSCTGGKIGISEGLTSRSGHTYTSSLLPPVRSGGLIDAGKKEETTIAAAPENSTRTALVDNVDCRNHAIGMGTSDEANEKAPSEPEDKASLLYTDNIMAAAAATNEMASGMSSVPSPGSGEIASEPRDDLSALSAAGLLGAATSQVFINQLILQNTELHHRNQALQKELETIKQQVARVLTHLMAHGPPDIHQQVPTSNSELGYLRRLFPGLGGGPESMNVSPGIFQGAGLGQEVPGFLGDVSTVSALLPRQPASSSATSSPNEPISQGTLQNMRQPGQQEQQQHRHQQYQHQQQQHQNQHHHQQHQQQQHQQHQHQQHNH
jgi:hypothetical protein